MFDQFRSPFQRTVFAFMNLTRTSPNKPKRGAAAQNHCSSAGFSLVEVVLAMGVISFAMISVIGLLPVGLSTFQRAMDQTVEGQIIQRINGEMMLTPFKQLSASYNGKTTYFDMEGQLLPNATDAKYKVETSLIGTTYPGSTNAVYPGASSPAEAVASNVQGIQVSIIKMPGATATNKFNIKVPNSGT